MTNIDFILPLYDRKALHSGAESAEEICIRTTVKGFSFFPMSVPGRN